MSKLSGLGNAVNQEFTLAQLLSEDEQQKLQLALQTMLQTDVQLLDDHGNPLTREPANPQRGIRAPLRSELEAIGYLQARMYRKSS